MQDGRLVCFKARELGCFTLRETLASITRESDGASLKTGPLLVAESRSRAHASAADRPGHLRDVDEAMRVAFRVVRIDNEFAAFQVV